jgi:hypothetical protein
MAGAAGYGGQHRFLFSIVVPVTSNASHVEDIGPVSYQVFVRGDVFSNGAADKPFLHVAIAACETFAAAVTNDGLCVAVMMTVAATCAIVHEMFFVVKWYRTGVDRRINVFGTSSVNGTVEIDDLGNGFLGNRYANGQHNDSSAYDQDSYIHRLLS